MEVRPSVRQHLLLHLFFFSSFDTARAISKFQIEIISFLLLFRVLWKEHFPDAFINYYTYSTCMYCRSYEDLLNGRTVCGLWCEVWSSLEEVNGTTHSITLRVSAVQGTHPKLLKIPDMNFVMSCSLFQLKYKAIN